MHLNCCENCAETWVGDYADAFCSRYHNGTRMRNAFTGESVHLLPVHGHNMTILPHWVCPYHKRSTSDEVRTGTTIQSVL